MVNKIILIGGSPTAGKSYTARRLAEQLKLPWISTDTIREQMRKIVRKEDYPALFLHSNYTSKLAVEFLSHNTDEEIDRVRKTIFTRGLWDDASKYYDSVKEKEVEWVVAFNNYITKEAKKYRLPVVSIGDRKDYINKVK